MFNESVNTVFINKLLIEPRIPGMHESVSRLLNFARSATAGTPEAVHDFAGLSKAMGVSSATMTNWKSRGVSVEGALAAERRFGCFAVWVLDGGDPAGKAAATAQQFSPLAMEIAEWFDAMTDPTKQERAHSIIYSMCVKDRWPDAVRQTLSPSPTPTPQTHRET